MIFQNTIWNYTGENLIEIQRFAELINQPPLIAKLLLERGLSSPAEVERFMNPKIEHLRDPFLMQDMRLAVDRIEKAIQQQEHIWIYGDYDVDGITSIAILMKYFEYRGNPASFYIPDRQDEGYGISEVGLKNIQEMGGTLVITVDCGITAIEQAIYSKNIGLDLIITDHHEFHGEVPDAIAVVNPKREGYPFKMLAGCGVALKLVQALAGDDFRDFHEQIIDIAALGTVADIVPLIDENRIITSLGLSRMTDTKNPGIQALISEAMLVGKEVNSGHIGFVIAPRINASGRIGNPSIAVNMLIEKDYFKALEIAKKLSLLNTDRQMQEREIMEAAEAYIKSYINLDKEKIMLVVGNNWHTGIIGIVASKLSDKYSRPTVILNSDGEYAKGSARSIDGISIYDVLYQFKDLFEKFGGHEQAAGLSLKAENITALKAGLESYSETHIRHFMLVSKAKVDGALAPQMVTHDLIESIEALKPFGMGNPKPQFVFNDLIVEDYKVLGKTQNHLKLIVNDGNRVYDAMAFNQSSSVQFLRKTDKIHLLMTLEKNNFMGVETIQFNIKDMIKERMPFSEMIQKKIQKAIYAFIKDGTLDDKIEQFTRLEAFDIIFTAPLQQPILLYSYEALSKFKDQVMKYNFLKYTIHFNRIDPKETREGYNDILFMPIAFTGNEAYYYPTTTSKMELVGHLPDRNDLAQFYKTVLGKTEVSMETLTHRDIFSQAKARLCLDLLHEMKLVDIEENSGFFKLIWLPKPNEKIDLENIEMYQKILKKWK